MGTEGKSIGQIAQRLSAEQFASLDSTRFVVAPFGSLPEATRLELKEPARFLKRLRAQANRATPAYPEETSPYHALCQSALLASAAETVALTGQFPAQERVSPELSHHLQDSVRIIMEMGGKPQLLAYAQAHRDLAKTHLKALEKEGWIEDHHTPKVDPKTLLQLPGKQPKSDQERAARPFSVNELKSMLEQSNPAPEGGILQRASLQKDRFKSLFSRFEYQFSQNSDGQLLLSPDGDPIMEAVERPGLLAVAGKALTSKKYSDPFANMIHKLDVFVAGTQRVLLDLPPSGRMTEREVIAAQAKLHAAGPSQRGRGAVGAGMRGYQETELTKAEQKAMMIEVQKRITMDNMKRRMTQPKPMKQAKPVQGEDEDFEREYI